MAPRLLQASVTCAALRTVAVAAAVLAVHVPAPARRPPPTRRTTCWSSPRPPASGTTRSRSGIQAIRDLGAANSFTVTATEDADAFTTAQPRPVRGGGLPQHHRRRAQRHPADARSSPTSARGGGYVGVHAAADTEYDWPFYGNLVGAYFASHPAIQQANVKVENRAHAATAHLPQTWTRTDEWYNYRTNPASTARVLATLDESSYSGGGMGADHPHHLVQDATSGGRSFYTGGGHTQASYAEPAFRSHLLGGIRYAAGRDQGRLPAGDRLHRRSTTARPPAGRRPGRAASPTPTPP